MPIPADDLSVVIPFRRDSADRLENLTAVVHNLAATLPGAEILLLEDGPVLSAEHLRHLPRLAYHGSVNQGAFHRTRLLNRGMIKLCQRPFVASCDTDVLIYPEAWQQALDQLRRGAAMTFPFDGRFLDLRGAVRSAVLASGHLGSVPRSQVAGTPRRGDIVCVNRASVGGCVLFRREVFDTCGGYHEGFLHWGFEDAELVSRMGKFGHPVRRSSDLPLLHLAHRRGKGSGWYRARRGNKALFQSLQKMTRPELEALIAQGGLRGAPAGPGDPLASPPARSPFSGAGSLMTRPLRLCFVTHRYAPYPGGSEIFVQAMAEEALRRGHEVIVHAGKHMGDLNGVTLTSDPAALHRFFDLVIVHGAFSGTPRDTLDRAARLASPVLYMLVAHRARDVRRRHLRDCRFLGWSTPLDQAVLARRGVQEKGVRVRHGIDPANCIGAPGFRARFGIPSERPLFLSCGGYWPHKRMRPLARAFEKAATVGVLVTTGYDMPRRMPRRSEKVMPLLLEDRADVLSALREADCYLMHSRDEGFGLVLLEAMLNKTPWIAHAVGGAPVLEAFGQTYQRERDLVRLIETFRRDDAQVMRARAEVLETYTTARTVDDIERVANSGGDMPPQGLSSDPD